MSEAPLFPLNTVLFPGGPLPLRIFETRYVDMVRECMREDRPFGVALIQKGGEIGPAQTHAVGTLAKITDFHQMPDGLLGLLCAGQERFRIISRSVRPNGLNVAAIERLAAEPPVQLPERHARLAHLVKTLLGQLTEVYPRIEMRLDDAAWVGHRLAEILPLSLDEKQQCLEMDDPLQRLDRLSPRA